MGMNDQPITVIITKSNMGYTGTSGTIGHSINYDYSWE